MTTDAAPSLHADDQPDRPEEAVSGQVVAQQWQVIGDSIWDASGHHSWVPSDQVTHSEWVADIMQKKGRS